MKILILDDHPLFSQALKHIVQNIKEVQTVDLAIHVDDALKYFDDGNIYDLLLLDIGLPGLDGFSFLKWLKINQIGSPVIIISASNDPDIAELSIQRGANGFIHKSEDVNTIIQGIKQVKKGNIFTSNTVSTKTTNSHEKSSSNAENLGITPRQYSILQLLENGDSNKEIARKLNISDSTVKKHISNLFKILSVQNRTALILESQRLKII